MRGRSPASAALAATGQTTSKPSNSPARVPLTSLDDISPREGRCRRPLCDMIQVVKPTRRAKTAIPPSGAPDTVELPSVAVKTKVWLEHNGQFVVGDGGLRLLLGILEHGSLLGAARQIRWSYRHAWEYLRRAEAALGMPLTQPRPGKGSSRGSALTEAGRLVIERLAEIRNKIDDAVGPLGPTAADVAARGKRRKSTTRAAAGRLDLPGTSRYRDGDWRRAR
jgi:molybdate transport system regulatory protein